ncbi:hypothetical protein F52700_5101 [Fusarium sp. NRRL 52700]|nr:hypothetical protein F52700_5101 [Fusarium sp. NRRL 52700]
MASPIRYAAAHRGSNHDNMALETKSEPVMEWIILIPDNKGSLETRMRVRETHLKDMLQHIESGLFQMGGGTLSRDSVNGSAIIARAKSEAEVLAVLENDVYARSGVWDLENIKFIPFKCVYRREHIDGAVMGAGWKF